MMYRMKRNGAGLASICILCTMVLVMVSSTVCLYLGAEDSLHSRYPRSINLDSTVSSLSLLSGEQTAQVRAMAEQASLEYGQTVQNVVDYHAAAFAGYVQNGVVALDNAHLYSFRLENYDNVWQVFIVPLEDYNRLMGQSETLAPGQALLYTTKNQTYEQNTVSFGGKESLQIVKTVPDFVDNGVDAMQIVPSMYLFVPDFDKVVTPLMQYTDSREQEVVNLHWIYGFDLNCDNNTQIQIQERLEQQLQEAKLGEEDEYFSILCEGLAKEWTGFYGLYGGLFFLGILLGIVFIFAAVLIMYYKQVSEGYEDQSRFEIMQKVGMTKREIKKSINSQILTVFFLPLVMAGLHLAFAFPLIYKLLALFGLSNIDFLIIVTICCYLVFAVMYILVYRITSRAYYSIVSGARKEAA